MPDLDPEALLRRRRNALLARWASGKRLSPQESEEIAGFLPKPAPELKLEAQVEGIVDKPYQRGREEYAAQYSQSVKTIGRWKAKGAPLDNPSAMAGWWASNMKHRVPDNLLALSQKPAAAAAAASAPGPAVDLPMSTLSPLDQARAVADFAFRELQLAQASTDLARIALAQGSYTRASEQLRRVELSDPKIRKAAGSLVDRETVRTVLTALHTSVVTSLRSVRKKLWREMAGKTPEEAEAIWQTGLDKIFDRFRDCEFADPI